MTTQALPKPIYFSSRIRLNDEQKKTLKDAYNQARQQTIPDAAPSIGGSAISVQTSYGPSSSLGLSDLTLRDLLSTRESISISLILKIQALLGVTIITKKEMEAEMKSYLNYIFSEDYASK